MNRNETIKNHYNDIETICFLNPKDLENHMEHCEDKVIDILIMDIVFKGDNGIAASKRIQNKFPQIPLIYLTGYIDYARDIFESDPIYFLVKPIDENKLFDAINRAIKKLNQKKKLIITSVGETYTISYDDIMYIESKKKHLYVQTNKENIRYIKKISEIEHLLTGEFIRIHQSFIVNANFIQSMDIGTIKLKNGEYLPISRHRSKYAKEQFLKFMRG